MNPVEYLKILVEAEEEARASYSRLESADYLVRRFFVKIVEGEAWGKSVL